MESDLNRSKSQLSDISYRTENSRANPRTLLADVNHGFGGGNSVTSSLAGVIDVDPAVRKALMNASMAEFVEFFVLDVRKMKGEFTSMVETVRSVVLRMEEDIKRLDFKGRKGYQKLRKSMKNGLGAVRRKIEKTLGGKDDERLPGAVQAGYNKGLYDLFDYATTMEQAVPSSYSSSVNSSRRSYMEDQWESESDAEPNDAQAKKQRQENKMNIQKALQEKSKNWVMTPSQFGNREVLRATPLTSTNVQTTTNLRRPTSEKVFERKHNVIEESDPTDSMGSRFNPLEKEEYRLATEERKKAAAERKKGPVSGSDAFPRKGPDLDALDEGLWKKMDPSQRLDEARMITDAKEIGDKMVAWLEKKEKEEKELKTQKRLRGKMKKSKKD